MPFTSNDRAVIAFNAVISGARVASGTLSCEKIARNLFIDGLGCFGKASLMLGVDLSHDCVGYRIAMVDASRAAVIERIFLFRSVQGDISLLYTRTNKYKFMYTAVLIAGYCICHKVRICLYRVHEVLSCESVQ